MSRRRGSGCAALFVEGMGVWLRGVCFQGGSTADVPGRCVCVSAGSEVDDWDLESMDDGAPWVGAVLRFFVLWSEYAGRSHATAEHVGALGKSALSSCFVAILVGCGSCMSNLPVLARRCSRRRSPGTLQMCRRASQLAETLTKWWYVVPD
jgi:hypothetical protein